MSLVCLLIRSSNHGHFFHSFRRRPRRGIEEEQWDRYRQLMASISLFPILDRWIWTLDSGGFSVALARLFIKEEMLVSTK